MITLSPSFLIKQRDDLGMGTHQFFLGQHMSATKKILQYRVDQHHVIVGRGGSPTMADAAYLTTPDGMYLPETLAMVRRSKTRLQVVLYTMLVIDHHSAHGMYAFTNTCMEQ